MAEAYAGEPMTGHEAFFEFCIRAPASNCQHDSRVSVQEGSADGRYMESGRLSMTHLNFLDRWKWFRVTRSHVSFITLWMWEEEH